MAIAKVQGSTGQGTGSPANIVFGSNTTSGNLIIVCVALTADNSTIVTSITDSNSNTYATAAGITSGTSSLEIWYAENITGGTTPTVTVNFTGTNASFTGTATEASGAATSGVEGNNATNTGTSTTPGGATVTVAAGTVAVWAITGTPSGYADTITEGTGWTLDNEIEFPVGGSRAIGVEYKVGVTTNQTPDWTLGSSAQWFVAAAAFKEPGASWTADMFQHPEPQVQRRKRVRVVPY